MTSKIISGKQIAKAMKSTLKIQIENRKKQGLRVPGLAVIQVGSDPASTVYVAHKRKACEEVGFLSYAFDLPEAITQVELLNRIHALNHDETVDGILVQLPLPAHIETKKIIEAISPQKDVDGFHPYNLGRLAQNLPGLRSCTPKGVMKLIASTGCQLEGKHAVVVGASNIVGRPMMLELLNAGATVTICHKLTQNLPDKIKQAEVLVVGIGQPKFIQASWIQPGAVVIDVGINRQEDGRLEGDVDFDAAQAVASHITPVPGGVGPMTIVSLLENTLQVCEKKDS